MCVHVCYVCVVFVLACVWFICVRVCVCLWGFVICVFANVFGLGVYAFVWDPVCVVCVCVCVCV